MANCSAIETNKHREAAIKRFSAKRARLKALSRDRSISLQGRFQAATKLAEMPRNSAAVRYRRRCALTGRPRGVHREYGLSRIAIRELALAGQLPGVIKSSW